MCSNHQHHDDVAADASVKGVTFQVDDMTCGHCAGMIKKALEHTLPGAAFSIDLASKQVTVAGDAAIAEKAIQTAGYQPERLAH
ncbi:heavy-metal-associated domain-containing protein [Aminobacter niigataensis]|uniref:heavy-metal-associated domain-containing protein n=1 Tax=Aminobacter niigataensis TaxID=83265 RepID=UPI0024C69842|nr:heavy-metal-associated domain-containing protein [Aminobacter niigataensis]CAI2933804.1 Copper chaperone [Aminobacter niigataensis]